MNQALPIIDGYGVLGGSARRGERVKTKTHFRTNQSQHCLNFKQIPIRRHYYSNFPKSSTRPEVKRITLTSQESLINLSMAGS